MTAARHVCTQLMKPKPIGEDCALVTCPLTHQTPPPLPPQCINVTPPSPIRHSPGHWCPTPLTHLPLIAFLPPSSVCPLTLHWSHLPHPRHLPLRWRPTTLTRETPRPPFSSLVHTGVPPPTFLTHNTHTPWVTQVTEASMLCAEWLR